MNISITWQHASTYTLKPKNGRTHFRPFISDVVFWNPETSSVGNSDKKYFEVLTILLLYYNNGRIHIRDEKLVPDGKVVSKNR